MTDTLPPPPDYVGNLKRGHRAPADLLAAIERDPLVSCWDLSEYRWRRDGVCDAVEAGWLERDNRQPYPWCRFVLTDAGRALLTKKTA